MSEKSSGTGAAKSKTPSTAKAAVTKPSTSKKESTKSASETASASDTSAEKPVESGAEKSADSGAQKSAESGGGKAQKETVSSSDVHYGYFSSVRTPAYRKGWDDIFGKKTSSGDNSEKKRTADRTKGARKTKKSTIKQPVTLELDIAELPEALRAGLSEEIRRKLKRRRINYDKLDRAGAVRWNIVCKIER